MMEFNFMKKLTYLLLIAFLACLTASTSNANAAQTSGKHQLRAGHKAGVHQGKAAQV